MAVRGSQATCMSGIINMGMPCFPKSGGDVVLDSCSMSMQRSRLQGPQYAYISMHSTKTMKA